jgi:hypothetical protein
MVVFVAATQLRPTKLKEFCLAKLLALFASWRLMRDCTFTVKAPRTPRNAKEISLFVALLLRVNAFVNPNELS